MVKYYLILLLVLLQFSCSPAIKSLPGSNDSIKLLCFEEEAGKWTLKDSLKALITKINCDTIIEFFNNNATNVGGFIIENGSGQDSVVDYFISGNKNGFTSHTDTILYKSNKLVFTRLSNPVAITDGNVVLYYNLDLNVFYYAGYSHSIIVPDNYLSKSIDIVQLTSLLDAVEKNYIPPAPSHGNDTAY